MAFEKTIEQPTGVAATYHRILRGTVDFTTGRTTVDFVSYVDRTAREADKQPVSGGSVTFDEMPSFDGDPRPWAYDLLKRRPEWADAKDV